MLRLWSAMGGATAIVAAMALPAEAQEASADEVAYPAAFFAEYVP